MSPPAPVRPRALWPVLLLAALVACGPSGATPGDADAPAADPSPAAEGYATIRGERIALELAITPQEQILGLGRRDALAFGEGMLFLYETPRFHRFWMKDMRFDIDIVWIRGDRIVDISHHVRHVPGGTGDQVSPRELADKVLEVPAGFAATRGWRPGHRVEIELLRGDWPPAG